MGMDNNESLYRPTLEEEAKLRLSGVTPRGVRTGEVCAICRHRQLPTDRSVCDTCCPPEEEEIKARCRLNTMRRENADLLASCEEHVRIRNVQGERIAELERALRYVADCSTLDMVRDTVRGVIS